MGVACILAPRRHRNRQLPRAQRHRAALISGIGRIRCCNRCSASARSRSATAPTAPSSTSPTSVSFNWRRRIFRMSRRATIPRARLGRPSWPIDERCRGIRHTAMSRSSISSRDSGSRCCNTGVAHRRCRQVDAIFCTLMKPRRTGLRTASPTAPRSTSPRG